MGSAYGINERGYAGAMTGLILCLDAAYGAVQAAAAGAVIDGWDAGAAKQVLVRRFESAPETYEPGAFYKRELPLLLPLISDVDAPIGVIVIDGYVWLSNDGLPGLGGHLFASLASRIPVIGVAKTHYRADTWSIPVRRGGSERALFVTSAGMDQEEAAACIRSMHGDHRIPTILAAVDHAARGALM
jgi:deoxyribonuclease V